MTEQDKSTLGDRLTQAYETMLGRVRQRMEQFEKESRPNLTRALDDAQEKALELGELSREEAEKLAEYVRKDLEDAANFISDSGRELGDWLKFDMKLIERGLADLFMMAVDKTRVELNEFAERAAAYGEWRTGEITAMGTLQCKSCGEVIHLHKPGHIPPCPKCRKTTFRRIYGE